MGDQLPALTLGGARQTPGPCGWGKGPLASSHHWAPQCSLQKATMSSRPLERVLPPLHQAALLGHLHDHGLSQHGPLQTGELENYQRPESEGPHLTNGETEASESRQQTGFWSHAWSAAGLGFEFKSNAWPDLYSVGLKPADVGCHGIFQPPSPFLLLSLSSSLYLLLLE